MYQVAVSFTLFYDRSIDNPERKGTNGLNPFSRGREGNLPQFLSTGSESVCPHLSFKGADVLVLSLAQGSA